jgi:hypothetical protein
MAYQGINTGSVPNDGTGDTLLDGAKKVNDNFSEIYNLVGDGTDLFVGIVTQITTGTNVSISTEYGSVEITSLIPSQLSSTNLSISGVSTLTGNVSLGSSLLLGDTKKILFGDNSEFGMYHDQNDGNIIQDNYGNFNIRSDQFSLLSSDGDTVIYTTNQDTNYGIDLYYNNQKKFETTENGVEVSGSIQVQSGINVSGIITASSFVGDGSNLTGIGNSIVGINTEGTSTFNQINASGIVTSIGGFISAASTSACQITFSGNTLTFTVVGVGSTTLTLV